MILFLRNSKSCCTFASTDSATLPIRIANQGGTFAFIPLMATTYTKEPLSVKNQIELLKSRGLIVDDEAAAEAMLYSVSYFRLVAYLRPMEANKETHEFKPNSHFDDAVALYRFDCELRNLIFKAVQDIEIALRTRIIQEFSMRNGAFWFYDTALAVDGHQFLENMTSLDRELKRSKEDFIREHYAKYDNPAFPPSWKSLELASFGTLSKFYYNFSDIRAKKIVARSFNLPQHEVLESWMRSIAVLRNCCAHHARIWNRVYPKMPQLTGFRPRGRWITNIPPVANRLYSLICCVAYWLDSMSLGQNFKESLFEAIARYPNVDVAAMGFPENWETEPLWSNN